MGNQSNLDLNADQYTKNSEIQLTLADKLLENYPIKKNAKILDIGCGDGRITSDLAHKAPNGKVIGLDASQNMIEYAQQHYPKNKCPNLEFVLEKAEELSITEKFDLIVSFNCFHWVRPWKEALKRFYDILNPKGEILFLTYPLENPFYKPFIEASKHFPEFIDQAAHTTMFSSQDLKNTLTKLGMTIISFDTYENTISYDTPEAMKDFIRIWLTSYIPLPKPSIEPFLDLLIEKSTPYRINKGDNKIHLPYQALFVNAVKSS